MEKYRTGLPNLRLILIVGFLFLLNSCTNKDSNYSQDGFLYTHKNLVDDFQLFIQDGRIYFRSIINADTGLFCFLLEPLWLTYPSQSDSMKKCDNWFAQPVFLWEISDSDTINYLPDFKVNQKYGVVAIEFYGDEFLLFGDIFFDRNEIDISLAWQEWHYIFNRIRDCHENPDKYYKLAKDNFDNFYKNWPKQQLTPSNLLDSCKPLV